MPALPLVFTFQNGNLISMDLIGEDQRDGIDAAPDYVSILVNMLGFIANSKRDVQTCKWRSTITTATGKNSVLNSVAGFQVLKFVVLEAVISGFNQLKKLSNTMQ